LKQFRGTTILSVRRDDSVVIGGDGQVSMGETVMVPLFSTGWSGIMAIGSFNPDRFEPGMGVELLANMAEVLSFILKPWIAET